MQVLACTSTKSRFATMEHALSLRLGIRLSFFTLAFGVPLGFGSCLSFSLTLILFFGSESPLA